MSTLRFLLAASALALVSACGAPAPPPAPAAPALSEAAQRGQGPFRTMCGNCHNVTGQPSQTAPTLANIIGKHAATGDFPYSAAMRGADITWTRESLDQFIADPRNMVPGNQMAFFGISDAAQRADIIEYLAAHGGPEEH